MNLKDYLRRQEILLEQKVISRKAYEVSIQSFKNLLKLLDQVDIEQAEMLFTHLPMALTRIAEGEKVESPPQEIVDEIKNSPFFYLAERQVAVIEEAFGKILPKSEKDYLMLHFVNVIEFNMKEVKKH